MVVSRLGDEVGDNSCMVGNKKGLLWAVIDGCRMVGEAVRMLLMVISWNGGVVRAVRMSVGKVEK